MPTQNQLVRFIGCSATSYANLQTYDENTLYFLTDTRQLYVGSSEYTKTIRNLSTQPNTSVPGEPGRIYIYNGNLYMCEISGYSYNWTRIANVNDCDGTVTSVTAGSGLNGGTITEAGVISHAVPVGAQTRSDSLADTNASWGSSFQIVGVTTDEFGHVTGVNLHTITLPKEPTLSVSTESSSTETLQSEGEFEVITKIEKGDGSHDLKVQKKTWKLPKIEDMNTTYTVEVGDQSGSIKLKGSDGSVTEAVIKDFEVLAKVTDVTSIFRYKGSIDTKTALPRSAEIGDVYYVKEDSTEYIYLGSDHTPAWEAFGPAFDLSIYALVENVIPRVKDATGQVPIFAEDGTLTSSGHTLATDVPPDAVFTDTVYKHPTFTPHELGMYKTQITEEGHVISVEPITLEDLVELGVSDENTDTKVKTNPNTTQKVYLAGSLVSETAVGELQVRPSVFVDIDGSLNADSFKGNVDLASRATSDESGHKIEETYLTKEAAEAQYATKGEASSAALVWQTI